jgi:hypothetical protein
MAQNGTPDTARRSILSHFYLLLQCLASYSRPLLSPIILILHAVQ